MRQIGDMTMGGIGFALGAIAVAIAVLAAIFIGELTVIVGHPSPDIELGQRGYRVNKIEVDYRFGQTVTIYCKREGDSREIEIPIAHLDAVALFVERIQDHLSGTE